MTIQFDVPDELLPLLEESSPGDPAGEIRVAAAVKMFEMGRLTSSRAAALAGLSRIAFLDCLHRYGVPTFGQESEELALEVESARRHL